MYAINNGPITVNLEKEVLLNLIFQNSNEVISLLSVCRKSLKKRNLKFRSTLFKGLQGLRGQSPSSPSADGEKPNASWSSA